MGLIEKIFKYKFEPFNFEDLDLPTADLKHAELRYAELRDVSSEFDPSSPILKEVNALLGLDKK